VDGVETYTVRLWQWQDANGGRQRILWKTTTSDASVVCGGDPPLAPESFYSVEVITDQGVTSDLDAGCAIAGFAVLFPETRSRLEADLASLTPATLTPEQLALAKAQVYLAYQMLNAAIDSLATQSAIAPTATLALGDLYSFAGLNTLAAEQYSLALALAPDDPLWQAIALEGLGELAVLHNDMVALQSFWDATKVDETSFTVTNLRRDRDQAQIIHLATHAQFLRGAPENSYLQFFDSRLHLTQVRGLGWFAPPVELVTLSACQTAMGNTEAELGFAGFALLSGAKSALASLWPVSDEATAGLMITFYQALDQEAIKAEALRDAQLAMINAGLHRKRPACLARRFPTPTS